MRKSADLPAQSSCVSIVSLKVAFTMRSSEVPFSLMATLFMGLCLVAGILILPDISAASPIQPGQTTDRAATLEKIGYALDEVADGATYVWRRSHGRLAGTIRPTRSFLDGEGRVCRHLVVFLAAPDRSNKREAVACRQENGIWRFDS